jgi:SAM-dependent methyltransferase
MSGAERTVAGQPELQLRHHVEIFGSLYEWDAAYERIVDLSGAPTQAGLLGFDQLSHFGPTGCDLVVEEILGLPGSPSLLCEFGSGFGGAVRHIVDRLARAGRPISAVGIDLVLRHCRIARQISRATGVTPYLLCADVARVPLRSATVDIVVSTGSVPHFPRIGAVLHEAARVLRPGGYLVLTEEVSLTRDPDVRLPGEFRRLHPEGVFFLTTVADRDRQLRDAGFTEIRQRSLMPWAVDLMTDRIKAIELFHGTADGIFGADETVRIIDSLRAARDLYRSGVLVPRMTVARRPAGPDRDSDPVPESESEPDAG